MILNRIIHGLLVFVAIGGISINVFSSEVPAPQSNTEKTRKILAETPKTMTTKTITKKTITISDDAKKLAAVLSSTITFQASFKQNVYRENSGKPEVSTGQFLIQRPSHFKWKTETPYQQVIIADGAQLWTYDPELEQVNIQNQKSILSDSPLLLLTSSVDQLVAAFDIVQVKQKDPSSTQLFVLSPRKSSLFESVHILIEGNNIKELFLLDTLGGRTSVQFENIKRNQKIEANEFIFIPPEGIDVIDSREVVNR